MSDDQMSDSKKTYGLATYGRGLSFTRQMLITDDLGAFNDTDLGAFNDTDDPLIRAWSDVRICQRCGGLSGGGKDICSVCRMEDLAVKILTENVSG